MECRLLIGAVEAAPCGLPIDSHKLSFRAANERLHPCNEGLPKGLRIERRQDATERVSAGNASGKFQKRHQPFLFASTETSDLIPAIRVADHRKNGDGENIEQLMIGASANARIGHAGEVLVKHGHEPMFAT